MTASGTTESYGEAERFQKLPSDFAKMDMRQAKRFLLDMIEGFETEGGEEGEELAGSYIEDYVKAINRWSMPVLSNPLPTHVTLSLDQIRPCIRVFLLQRLI